jgi:intracellular multiplication protein IcmB
MFNWLFSVSEHLAKMRFKLEHPAELCDLGTPIANSSYWVTTSGSLMTVIKISGCREYVLEHTHEQHIEIIVNDLRSQFRAGTTDLCWLHIHNDEIESNVRAMENALSATRAVSEIQGYNNQLFIDEMVAVMAPHIQDETTLLCVWTHKSEASQTKLEIPILAAEGSQDTKGFSYAERLIPSHAAKIALVLNAIRSAGMSARALSNQEVGQHIATTLDPEGNETFVPRLMGYIKRGINKNGQSDVEVEGQRYFLREPANPRAGIKGKDYSCIFPPLLGHQVWNTQPTYERDYTIIGTRAYSSIMVTLTPEMPVAFERLVDSLKRQRVPFRIAMHNKTKSPSAIIARYALAAALKKLPGSNKLIFDAIRQMREYIANQNPALSLQIVITVWSPSNDLELLRVRVQQTIKALGAWGGAQGQVMSDDSIFGLVSTLAPYRQKSVAPACIGPADEVLYMAPITRPSLPWETGGVTFRSRTGKLMPFQPLSDILSHHVYLVCGEPGFGKSLCCQMILIAIAETHDLLPYMAMTDVGPSSRGTIRYLQSIMPISRKHQIQYFEMRNDAAMSINRFDTPLGVRIPLADDFEAMKDWVLLGVSDSQTGSSKDGMDALVADVIRLAFERCADFGPRSEPKRYEESIVDDRLWAAYVEPVLRKHSIKLSRNTFYWTLVDHLFDLGEFHAAQIVQRLAVPLLDDLISACVAEEIRTAHRFELSRQFTLSDYAHQRLVALKQELLVTHAPTQLDLSQARVTSFNLEAVVQNSDSVSAKRSGALFFGLTSKIQVDTFFWNIERVNQIPAKYREYHAERLREIIRTKNIYFADEQHYFTGIEVANRIPDNIATMGRKRGIGVMLSTQLPRYFTPIMRDLATLRIYVGFRTASIPDVVETMRLNETERWILEKQIRQPNRDGSHMLIQVDAEDGRYSQLVNMRVGIRKLWGLSTKAKSDELRAAITNEFGYELGLEILALEFPSGEVESEYERIRVQMAEGSISTSGLESSSSFYRIDNIMKHIIDKTIANGKRLIPQIRESQSMGVKISA